VPKIPPPVIKDLSNADLSQQKGAIKMPASKKVQAVLNHARATQQGLEPEMWFEPFAEDNLGDDSRSEVMTLVFPHDSISMAGVPAQHAVVDPAIRQLHEYQHAPDRISSVYMHTSDGQRFAAKVDIDGISSTDELLRGLRAAYCHYTSERSPGFGSLLTGVVLPSGHEVHLREDVPVHAQPPLPGLLPCSHFVIHAYPTALIAAQQHHMRMMATADASGGGRINAGRNSTPSISPSDLVTARGKPAVPRPGDFVSLPVVDLPKRAGAAAAHSAKVVADDAWQHAQRAQMASSARPVLSVAERRQQFTRARAPMGDGGRVSELKVNLGASKLRASYRK